MTDRDRAELPHKERGPKRKWLGWPISFAVTLATAIGFHNDAVEAGLVGLYWISVILVAAFYALVTVVVLIRLTRRLLSRWTEFAMKARSYDALQAELESWKNSAGEATARADDATARLASWQLDNLNEGRRRVLAELQAATKETSFWDIEVAESSETLVVGARWHGQMPEIDSRYVIQSSTLNRHKAVLECLEVRENQRVVFRVSSVVSNAYRAQLIEVARATAGVLKDVEIAPRTFDLEKEPIWPEN